MKKKAAGRRRAVKRVNVVEEAVRSTAPLLDPDPDPELVPLLEPVPEVDAEVLLRRLRLMSVRRVDERGSGHT